MEIRQQFERLRSALVDLKPGHTKIYLFEVAILVQLGALHLLLVRKGLNELAVIHHSLTISARILVPLFLGGVVANLLYAAVRRRARETARAMIRWAWLFMSLRLLVASAVVVHIYVWLKCMLQLLNPTLYDQALWDLDRLLLFGFSPNVFALYLFQSPIALTVIDVSYSLLFSLTFIVAASVFMALPSDRLRVAFVTGYSSLWLVGAWLYLLVPSLGPCYVFPEVWQPFVNDLAGNVNVQRMLWANYQLVQAIPRGIIPPQLNLLAGVAAFPSLHVGLQIFVGLWLVRLHRGWRLPAYLATALMVIGSVVTGWHYLIDSLAGLVLGWAAFRLGHDLYRERSDELGRSSAGVAGAAHLPAADLDPM